MTTYIILQFGILNNNFHCEHSFQRSLLTKVFNKKKKQTEGRYIYNVY